MVFVYGFEQDLCKVSKSGKILNTPSGSNIMGEQKPQYLISALAEEIIYLFVVCILCV